MSSLLCSYKGLCVFFGDISAPYSYLSLWPVLIYLCDLDTYSLQPLLCAFSVLCLCICGLSSMHLQPIFYGLDSLRPTFYDLCDLSSMHLRPIFYGLCGLFSMVCGLSMEIHSTSLWYSNANHLCPIYALSLRICAFFFNKYIQPFSLNMRTTPARLNRLCMWFLWRYGVICVTLMATFIRFVLRSL